MLEGLPFPLAFGVLFGIVMLRANATYWIGRGAESGAERTRLSRALESPKFRRAQAIVARWGAPVVTVSFLTVGIQTLINLAAGVARMPLRRYLPAVTLGCILWALLYATVGFVTFAAWLKLYELSPAAAIVGTVVLLAALAAFIWWQARRSRVEQPDKENSGEPHHLAAHD
jgi:membrane protein DedA with SNARE-associated domain